MFKTKYLQRLFSSKINTPGKTQAIEKCNDNSTIDDGNNDTSYNSINNDDDIGNDNNIGNVDDIGNSNSYNNDSEFYPWR